VRAWQFAPCYADRTAQLDVRVVVAGYCPATCDADSTHLCFYDAHRCHANVSAPMREALACGAGGVPSCRYCGFDSYPRCPPAEQPQLHVQSLDAVRAALPTALDSRAAMLVQTTMAHESVFVLELTGAVHGAAAGASARVEVAMAALLCPSSVSCVAHAQPPDGSSMLHVTLTSEVALSANASSLGFNSTAFDAALQSRLAATTTSSRRSLQNTITLSLTAPPSVSLLPIVRVLLVANASVAASYRTRPGSNAAHVSFLSHAYDLRRSCAQDGS
jgi:hypothetical protein